MLLTKIDASGASKEDRTTLVQCLSLVAKATGGKMAPHIGTLVPKLSVLMKDLDPEEPDDHANELSEACLATIEAITRRCPKDIAERVPELFKETLGLIRYDPHFNADAAQDEEVDMEGWGDEDDPDEDIGVDNDDSTWRVRRGAIFLIDALIKAKPEF